MLNIFIIMNINQQASYKVPRQIFLYLLLILLSVNVNCQTDSITDNEGNSYKIVQIGNQWWMAENLRVTKYANGEEIAHVTNDSVWANTNDGAYCYYENNEENVNTFGNLYNWHTVNDPRGISPSGWHVPSDREWMELEKYLGMSASEAGRMTAWRGTIEGDMLKSDNFGGNNSSGFSALGTGYRDPKGIYKAMGTDNDYWTSTAYSSDNSIYGILHGLLNSKSTVVRNFHVPGYGFCVRCVKDNTTDVNELPKMRGVSFIPILQGNS